DPLPDSPFDSPVEHIRAVVVHSEHETSVDHDAQAVQATDRRIVVPPYVLILALLGQIRGVHRLESYEEASQAGTDCFLQQARALQDGLDGPGRLPEPSHPPHAVEQGSREPRIPEQVVIEKVKVTPGQPVDLRERIIDGLRIELLSALEEGHFV